MAQYFDRDQSTVLCTYFSGSIYNVLFSNIKAPVRSSSNKLMYLHCSVLVCYRKRFECELICITASLQLHWITLVLKIIRKYIYIPCASLRRQFSYFFSYSSTSIVLICDNYCHTRWHCLRFLISTRTAIQTT